MKATVKISQLTQKLKTNLINFGTQSFATNIFGSESISNHNVALFLFDYKIWLNQWKNIIQHWASCLPVIDRSGEFLFTRPSIAGIFRSTESGFEPNNKLFIAASDLKHGMPLIAIAVFALFGMSDVDATFSIDQSRKISDFSNCMCSLKVNNFSHECPFVNNSIIFNEERVHAERLSEKTLNWDAIV